MLYLVYTMYSNILEHTMWNNILYLQRFK